MTDETTSQEIQDHLNRDELLGKLKAQITQTPNPTEHGKEEGLVMCINGGFGTGKTWTLNALKTLLEDGGNPVAYLSAWESDHAGDAMVAIISQLDELILKETKSWLQENNQSSVLDKLKESSGRVARAVLKSLPAALEEIPGGKLLSETINNYLDVADSAKEPQKHDAIEQFELRSKALTQSKAALTTLAGNEFFASNGKRLVILIDELDRCRPTYAIEMLEAIKHWFCVPNVVFVLAMDREQLSHSIRAVYGQGFDVDGYFLRFFHRLEQMPTLNETTSTYQTEKRIVQYFRLLGISEERLPSKSYLLNLISRIDNLTLRECQSIYREWKYLVDAGKDTVCSKENKLDFAFLFCLLKTKHPSDYDFIFSYLVFKSKSDAIRKYRFADKNEYLPNQIKQAEKINSLSDPPYCPLDFHVDRFYYYRYQAPKEILKELLKDHKINDRLNLVEIN